MNDQSESTGGAVLVNAVTDWLMQQALGQADIEDIFDGCCQRLDAAGLPVARAMIFFRTLHPLYASTIMFWHRGENVRSSRTRHEDAFTSDEFTNSPIYRLSTTRTPFLRRRLRGDTALLDFPVLEDLKEQGSTDYLAYKVAFSSDTEDEEYEDGIIGSWTTERPSGFTDQEILWLMRVQSRMAVACKMQIREAVTQNVLDAYLGPNAGDRVMRGNIRRDSGEQIDAVIWYSDMRDSTRWADDLEPEDFLTLINAYFECTAGSVIANGGEVLRFIGDAVLAIFPIDGDSPADSRQAANLAIKAMRDAESGIDKLNAQRRRDNLEPIQFGLGLHVGRLTFGNIGVAERLEFSVVGPAANEVARLEALCKKLKQRVLASEEFAALTNENWDSHGAHTLRGSSQQINVLSPSVHQN
jgi:adenylate cyclase